MCNNGSMLLSNGSRVRENHWTQIFNVGTMWILMPVPLGEWVPGAFPCMQLMCGSQPCSQQSCDFNQHGGQHVALIPQGELVSSYPKYCSEVMHAVPSIREASGHARRL